MSFRPKTLILDFDNTLYDWVSVWHASFAAFLREVVEISGLNEDLLKAEIRKVHQEHHTSEYAFLIEALGVLSEGDVDSTVAKYMPAVEARRAARRANLRLYDGVMETLAFLKDRGVTIAVFTESQTFYSLMRFKKFGLDGVVDYLFTSDDHELPDDEYVRKARAHSDDYYKLKDTKYTSIGRWLKPDPHVLQQIISDVGASPESVLYVGDSLYKDILMANSAGITSAWARYGEAREHPGYALLRDVSHWTDADVEQDKKFKAQEVNPDYTLAHSLSELTPIFED